MKELLWIICLLLALLLAMSIINGVSLCQINDKMDDSYTMDNFLKNMDFEITKINDEKERIINEEDSDVIFDNRECDEVVSVTYEKLFEEYRRLTPEILEIVLRECDKYDNVKPQLILSIMYEESRFQPEVKSPNKTCVGLMQISTKWHNDRRIELCGEDSNMIDISTNITVGVNLVSELLNQYETSHALMIYNMGYTKAAFYVEGNIMTIYAKNIMLRSLEMGNLMK